MAAITKTYCICLLKDKQSELDSAGESRYPRRGDFTPEEAAAIKAVFGPWPRALEAAGLKAEDPGRKEKKKQKRIAQKRKRTERKISSSLNANDAFEK